MLLSFNFNIIRSSKRVSPIRIVCFGVLFFLVMWLIAPVSPVGTLTFDSVAYIVLCILSCILGTILLPPPRRKTIISYNSQKLLYIYRILLGLSVFAVTLRLFIIFVVRGQGIGLDSFEENIDSGLQNEASLLSIISAVFYFVPFLPVFLNIVFPNVTSNKSKLFAFFLYCFIGINFPFT